MGRLGIYWECAIASRYHGGPELLLVFVGKHP